MNLSKIQTLKIARTALLSGYFGLFTLLMCWYIWISPSQNVPTFLVLLLFVGPLLIPLRGVIHGREKGHAWLPYLALFYFIHGVGELFVATELHILPLLEILLSCTLYLGALCTIRISSKLSRT